MSEIDKDLDQIEANLNAPKDDVTEVTAVPKEKSRRGSGKRKAKVAAAEPSDAADDAGQVEENKFKPSVLNAIDWNASAKQLHFLETDDSVVMPPEDLALSAAESAELSAAHSADATPQGLAGESSVQTDRLTSEASVQTDCEPFFELSMEALELEGESDPELNARAESQSETGGTTVGDDSRNDLRSDSPNDSQNDSPSELADAPEIPSELDQFASTQFVAEDQLISVIESLLFSTDKPVSVATIKTIFKGTNIRNKDIEFAIDGLSREYASPTRGVALEEVNGGYQLRTKSDNAEFLRGLTKVRPFRLSGPALEVMSIVAYKQPVTKNEIDAIRGVESGHLLRALMERGLVYFAGKSELPGKPMTYGSTRKFLEIFGLRNIRELPTLSEIDELLPDGIGEVEEKETLAGLADSMSQAITSSYSEGEQELEKINEQLKAVDTTSEFFEQEKERERLKRDHDRAQDIREKLVLGDAVEDKDKKWLARFEAKLLEPKVEPGSKLAATEPSIGGELSSLSAETLTSISEAEASEVLKEADGILEADRIDDEHGDDLTDRLDWDDDAHSDDHGSDHDSEGM